MPGVQKHAARKLRGLVIFCETLSKFSGSRATILQSVPTSMLRLYAWPWETNNGVDAFILLGAIRDLLVEQNQGLTEAQRGS